MFTSRAEYRILLRQDNADIRLTPIGHEIGLADDDRLERVGKKQEGTSQLIKAFRTFGVTPVMANPILLEKESAEITQQVKLSSLITRPHISMEDVLNMSIEAKELSIELLKSHPDIVVQAEIQMKYQGYIEREEEIAKKMNRLEDVVIPDSLNYASLVSVSYEAREKLLKIKPVTIGQAARISGVSPSDIAVLLIHLGR
jgi:tRNA uridine 5-carboxymethylaminomethyl modification enzyme